MKLALILAAILLAGCENQSVIDQCMRRDLFQQCMKSLPAGPKSTKYNDWDEVIGQCDNTAYYQSYRKKEFVKPECRS